MHASCSCKQVAACVRAMNCSREQEHQDGLDWLEDSISFLTADVDIGSWWSTSSATLPAAQQDDDIGSVVAQTLSPPEAPPMAQASPSVASPAAAADPASSSSNKKRKSASGQKHERPTKKGGKGCAGSSSERDMRWAEQLLNPCAAALEAGNLSRVQHLFYVLGELASFSGDPNHRLAAHGLRALARRLPAAASGVLVPPCPAAASFACADPRVFRAAVIRFHEVSPWFALPNALANATILAHHHRHPGPLHVVDLGVSHGVQWPTLLESLTRRPGGGGPGTPLVRLTVAGPAAASAPFASAPPGYDFSPHLLRYAASIDLRLSIDRAASLESVRRGEAEALVVCLQFRLGHAAAEERGEVLRKVRALNPELVVLSELDDNAAAGCGGEGGAAAFAARLGTLWRFLESTAAAFKGRDGDERRLMEAEAGASLVGEPAGDGREAWRGRMAAAGFQEQAFGDEAVESAKSLLRKYDGGWEMAAAGAAVALRWKAQPVSFCSLWRPLACVSS